MHTHSEKAVNLGYQEWDIKPPQDAAGTQRKTSVDRSLRACGVLRRFDYLY
jgi:hypothetical protein